MLLILIEYETIATRAMLRDKIPRLQLDSYVGNSNLKYKIHIISSILHSEFPAKKERTIRSTSLKKTCENFDL